MTGPSSGWPRTGVHRVLGAADEVASELAARGWDVAVVVPARTETELWDSLVEALRLPDWFGRNLDAVDEVLTDLVRPTALVLAAWWRTATAQPGRWAGLLEVLGERTTVERPPLLVVLAD